MSPNQRLIVAVLLSVIFFVGYTTIFPPKESAVAKTAKTNSVARTKGHTDVAKKVQEASGHAIAEQEKVEKSVSSDIVTIKNKKFILKIDSLGRIASKELLEDKFKNSDHICK